MIYHRSVRCVTGALAAVLAVSLSAVGSVSAGDDQQALLPSFTLAFSAIGGQPGTSSSRDETAADMAAARQERRDVFRHGEQISTRDLLAVLASQPDQMLHGGTSLFHDATLGLVFQDHGLGSQDVLALAECPTLDLEMSDPILQGQSAYCGDHTFTYGVGTEGLEVLRDGEIVLHLPLEPGFYSLNGVPFAVEAQ
ncbi:MAG: hypothetical protein ACFB01_12900 [Cohaesibacteraceae bacterium]